MYIVDYESKIWPKISIFYITFVTLWNECNFFGMFKVWQYGLWSFQMGGTKFERFLPKNQHTQRKLLNFENWINGDVSKVPKFD